MDIQLSGVRPSTCDNLSAISGEMLLVPFNSLVKVEGETFRFFATFLELRAKGSRYTSRMNSPGWGGLYMLISGSPHSLQYAHCHLQA